MKWKTDFINVSMIIDISRRAFFYCWITARLISMQVLLCNAGYPPSWPILAHHLLLAPLYEHSGEKSSISLKQCRHDGIIVDKLIYIWLLIYAAVCSWYMILLIRQDTCRWLPSQVPRPTCWWFFSCPGQLNRWHCHSLIKWVTHLLISEH